MPQVFAQGGGAPVVPAPMLSGNYIPNIDTLAPSGLGLVSPWGSGANIRRYSPSSGTTLTPASAAIQDSLALLAASVSPQPPIVNFNFEGLVGPQGPPGPSVAPVIYEVVPWGANQADYPPESFTDKITADFPLTSNIDFTDGGAGEVDWTSGTLVFAGTTYNISSGNAASGNKWIYWDSSSSPTTFSSTATLATAIGTTKWVMCYNDGGTPYVPPGFKILHGGLIEVDTINATHMAVDSITAANGAIANLAVVSGTIANLSVDTLQIAGDAIETVKVLDEAMTKNRADTTAGAYSITSSVTWAVLQTITNFPSVGGLVHLNFSVKCEDNDVVNQNVQFAIFAATVLIHQFPNITVGANKTVYASDAIVHVPGSGNVTYELKVKHSSGTTGTDVSLRTFSAEETQK